MDYLCPILVARKSVQDVAQSIYDGRWNAQKKRMHACQMVFGHDNCRMVYIIEVIDNQQMANGGYLSARWFNVDKERLQEEILKLQNEGFEVVRTTSMENCMFELARWAQQVSRLVDVGPENAGMTKDEVCTMAESMNSTMNSPFSHCCIAFVLSPQNDADWPLPLRRVIVHRKII